ncbi:MAG: hypothetical protein DMG80_12395 [Acidobacteria bacterium]|jgi:hypothetical protein|nr:MAG: hypothetical protein DMG80_12395 [Acidobacteriota bacterium]
MKNHLCAICAAALLSITMSWPAAAQEKHAAKLHRVQMAGKEQHPEINAAIVHLREAKQNLEHAAHDFGGHRVNALKHVNEALEECRLALEADKK